MTRRWRPTRLTRLLALHQLQEAIARAQALDDARERAQQAGEADDWQRVVDAVFAPPCCGDCTPGWACRVHDGCYWRALEATEGLDQ